MTIARMIVRCEASNETACILTITNFGQWCFKERR